MCGIAGYTIGQHLETAKHNVLIEHMLDAIAHRGPDQRGVEINRRVVFGHNRLTIMEPDGGTQPRVDPASGNALVYNGEIYGYRTFDKQITAAGHVFRDHCDTETLFLLIAIYGVTKAVSMLDGMFAFAYHDAKNDTLYLARDACGQKPLFYAEAGDGLVFASEIKALLCHPSLQRRSADVDALSLYLTMEYVPGSATGISGVKKLEPGSVLTYSHGSIRIERYWKPSEGTRLASVDRLAAEVELEELLESAVSKQLVADVPVGIFLSGGLDSSIIAALVRRQQSEVATFTIKFPQASFDESKHAEEVARQLETRHTTIELDENACVDGIREVVAAADQPFCDSSMLPTYLLCRATRDHVTVALGGDGADELFLGYPNFRLLRLTRLMQCFTQRSGRVTGAVAGTLPRSSSYMNSAFLLRQLSYGFGMPADTQSVHWMSAIAAREQDDLWLHKPSASTEVMRSVAEQVGSADRHSRSEICQRHFLEYYLPDDILNKTDRASMASSLEVRAPFLSSDVANFALSLPHSLLYRGQTGKQILRSVSRKFLPEQTISRPKHGFAMPVSALVRGALRDEVEPIILDRSNTMYEHLDFSRVNEMWRRHVSGKRDYGKKIWALFMLANFFRNTLQTNA